MHTAILNYQFPYLKQLSTCQFPLGLLYIFLIMFPCVLGCPQKEFRGGGMILSKLIEMKLQIFAPLYLWAWSLSGLKICFIILFLKSHLQTLQLLITPHIWHGCHLYESCFYLEKIVLYYLSFCTFLRSCKITKQEKLWDSECQDQRLKIKQARKCVTVLNCVQFCEADY